jgi:hypothetical protein
MSQCALQPASGGLFRAAYYGAIGSQAAYNHEIISTLVCYASNWNRLLNRGKPLLLYE